MIHQPSTITQESTVNRQSTISNHHGHGDNAATLDRPLPLLSLARRQGLPRGWTCVTCAWFPVPPPGNEQSLPNNTTCVPMVVRSHGLAPQHEWAIYDWLAKHSTRAQELPLLRQDLEALDSLVTSVAEPASPCPSSRSRWAQRVTRGFQTEQASSPKTPGSSSNSEAPMSTRRRGLKRLRED